MDDRLTEAQERYEAAVFAGAHEGLAAADRALDAVEADAALARGRIRHARLLAAGMPGEDPEEIALFDRALALYRSLGDTRGEAESLFWVGCYHQVVRHDMDASEPMFARAAELGDDLTRSYALRHLAFAAHHAGRLDDAHAALTESTALRRALGFDAGVAANLIAAADFAAEGGPGDAEALLDEAATLAAAAEAHAVASWVDEARAAHKAARASST